MKQGVLIVDDIAFVRNTLSQILKKNRVPVIAEAKDGKEAVELYHHHKPALVLMDIVMPEMSGIEATREIIKKEKEAKIVMVTAMGQEHMVMEALTAGAVDYIMKPFDVQVIQRTVDHFLQIHRSQEGEIV